MRVFVTRSELASGVTRSWVLLGLLGVTFVLIAIGVTDRLGRSMVTPVVELSDAADRLRRGDLDVRVQPTGPPELVAVGQEFNRLADRVTALLQRERETSADLSHRLRTPLAAARLDAEAMPHGPNRDRILVDLDEVDRTVTHIIRLARRQSGTDAGPSDLVAAVRNRFDFWSVLAEDQGRKAELDLPEAPVQVGLDATDLEAALDALFGNVFAHTEAGTPYHVEVTLADGLATLVVADQGPGFRDAGLLDRGESTAGSTGLGLDIVRRHVEDAGGIVAIGLGNIQGAKVIVTLPVVSTTPKRPAR